MNFITDTMNAAAGYRTADMGGESEFYYDADAKMWKKRGETVHEAQRRHEELKKNGQKMGMGSPGMMKELGAAPPPPPDFRSEEQKRLAQERAQYLTYFWFYVY